MARQAVVYGNLTAALIVYLLPVLNGTTTYAAVPKERPKRFVQLTPSGGSDISVVHDRALMMVDSWGPSILEAQELAQLVRAHLGAILNDRVNGVLIYRARPIGGIVYVPDPESDTPRYRQNWEFVTRGEPIL